MLRRLYRTALWRVRNRLLLTSFLFGVVPLLLIAFLLSQGSQIVLGQYASSIVREAIDHQITATETTARLLARSARVLAAAGTAASNTQLDDIRQQAPNVRLVLQTNGRTVTLPEAGDLRQIPDWMEPDFKGLLESAGRYYIAASAVDKDARVLAYRPLNGEALSGLTRGDMAVAIVPLSDLEGSDPDADVRIDLGSGRSFIRRNGVERPLEGSGAAIVPPRGFPDRALSWLLPVTVKSVDGRSLNVLAIVTSTRALIFSRLFSSLGPAAIPVAIVMAIVALSLLLVEIVSFTWSIGLTRTITRSVHELYEATQQVAAGNLAHRAPLRGFDQLTDLAGSFNTMADRIQQLIADVKEKEKIEAELEIARRVQLELFPKQLPNLSSLELAGVCMPSRFVSGDYYDCVTLGNNWTAIVLGDVSGKGIGAALVMATLQAALHAQLKFGGGARPNRDGDEPPSTARLTERLSEQLYENTPGEKYATLFCSLYDEQSGRLMYTNAGHLPPLLIRDGRTVPFETSGTVVGLLPIFSYEQQIVELQDGDLLAIFSDGVTEAENAAGEQFEASRLSDLLQQHTRLPLGDLIKIVTDHLTQWIHHPETRDDITLVLARKRPAAG